MRLCTYEDRAENLIGIKLLARSLARHTPQAHLQITCPVADEAFTTWCGKQQNITLLNRAAPTHNGWDVKPALLQGLLDDGCGEAFWIDADIVLTDDIRPLLLGLDEQALVGAEDHPWAHHLGGSVRTQGWGMPVGRVLPNTFNTCVMRVTNAHRSLLHAWADLTAHPDYRAAKRQPIETRPPHLRGGQDLLTALLGSERFADVPIHWVRCGRDIVHCAAAAGHTVGQRLRHSMVGLPPLVHAMARKPWALDRAPLYERLYLETSAYTAVAGQYGEALDATSRRWTCPQTPIGKLLHCAAFGNASMRGLPLACGESIVRWKRSGQRRKLHQTLAELGGRSTASAAPTNQSRRAKAA